MSDGIPAVTWDDQCKMKPGPASGLPAASRCICRSGCWSFVTPEERHAGEVWVELDVEMRAIAVLGSTVKWFCVIREERKGYAIPPAVVAFVSR